MTIDLNCDVGEMADDTIERALMPHITSANVACGAHAGDVAAMERTVQLARLHHVAVGAHPGYPDRENFGRIEIPLSSEAIARTVYEQVTLLAGIAGRLSHVKPHGALYNVAAKKPEVARAIAEGVARCCKDVPLMGLAGSQMLEVFRDAGFPVAAEGFADRRYEPDGTLRPRKFADALITDPEEAAAQAVRLALDGRAQTICVHSDTPGSVRIVEEVAKRLRAAGITLQPLRPPRPEAF